MNLDMTELVALFVEEAQEHLEAMESRLLRLDPRSAGAAELNDIFRAAHSIKGGAATFGLADVTEVAHVMENLLDKLRARQLDVTAEIVDTLLKATDLIRAQIAARESGGGAVDAAEVALVCERLREQAAGQVDAPGGASAAPTAPAPEAAPPAQDIRGEGVSFGFFGDEPAPSAPAPAPVPAPAPAPAPAPVPAPVPAASPAASASPESSSIRVSTEKVDQLINLVGELVITQSMLAQALGGATGERITSGMAQLERNTRELQEATMAIRMLPISSVFARFPRMVRDLAARLGKDVELRVSGEGTELDRGLIEKITDPLTHLVRNSLDHGIESPAERIASGKPAQGTIMLKAAHQGGNVVIEVSDDGRGLRRDRILAKARERGMAVSDNFTDQEVWSLIFEPGFSTATEVTDVSGRGVGMDVVRSNIAALGGRVDIQSESGMGTRIVVRLPLTLAILDGLSVACGDEMFIVPLASIVESLRPAPGAVRTVSEHSRVIEVRGDYLPVLGLGELFGIPGAARREEDGILVVLDAEDGRVALFVDALVGQHQVVIKSLETHYRKVDGVLGATILGDGRVALILDATSLGRQAHSARRSSWA